MTKISKFNSKVKKSTYGYESELKISVCITLDEPQAKYILTVTEGGCQIKEVDE